jgi:hypothetical protein
MARNRRKKALYEVISKTWPKTEAGRLIEPMQPVVAEKEEPPAPTKPAEPGPEEARWPTRPNVVQVNAGRIEISIPYQIAIALLLGLVVMVLGAYRLGQASSPAEAEPTLRIVSPPDAPPTKPTKKEPTAKAPTAGSGKKNVAAEQQGDHVIVLVQFRGRDHLVPVQEYFSENGIETVIMPRANGWFFLVTKERFFDTEKPGGRGYAVKELIHRIGPSYAAPAGFEPFPRGFTDAYGRNISEWLFEDNTHGER